MVLIGHGLLPWCEVSRLAEPCRAAWADYDGFHVGDLPPICPPYSHIWAWSDQCWLRIRPDGDGGAIVGELRLVDSDDDLAGGEPVDVHVLPGLLWNPADQRVTPRGDDLTGAELHLIEVPGATAVSFLHEGPLPGSLR